MNEPRSFECGEVWVSPKGFLYRVMQVIPYGTRGRLMAVMRSGYSGDGRMFRKWASDTKRWVPYFEQHLRGSDEERSDTGSQQGQSQPDTEEDFSKVMP